MLQESQVPGASWANFESKRGQADDDANDGKDRAAGAQAPAVAPATKIVTRRVTRRSCNAVRLSPALLVELVFLPPRAVA